MISWLSETDEWQEAEPKQEETQFFLNFSNKNPVNQRLSDRRRRVYPDRFWETGAGSRTRTQLLSQSGLSAPGRESELQGPTDNPSHQLLLKRPLKSLESAWSFRGPSSAAASKDSWVLLSIHSPLHPRHHPTSQRWIPKRWNKLQLRAPLQTTRGTVRKCGSIASHQEGNHAGVPHKLLLLAHVLKVLAAEQGSKHKKGSPGLECAVRFERVSAEVFQMNRCPLLKSGSAFNVNKAQMNLPKMAESKNRTFRWSFFFLSDF